MGPTTLKTLATRLRTGAATHTEFEQAVVTILDYLAKDEGRQVSMLRAVVRGGERELLEQKKLLAEFDAAEQTPPALERG